jgi:hypothetical protein
MSFLKSLFGGSKAKADAPTAEPDKTTGKLDYKGFVIRAVPFKSEGQFQTAGIIEKEIDGTLKSYRFVRADRSTMVEDVTELALGKGQKIIDEQGDAIFN